MNTVTALLEHLKDWVLDWRLWLFAMFFSAMALLLPEGATAHLGLSAAVAEHRAWIGFVFLGSTAACAVHLCSFCVRRAQRGNRRQAVLARIDSLSTDECRIITFCLVQGQQSVNLPLSDSAARSLCQKGLLATAAGTGTPLLWTFTIPDFVWDHIRTRVSELAPESERRAITSSRWFRRLLTGQADWRAFNAYLAPDALMDAGEFGALP